MIFVVHRLFGTILSQSILGNLKIELFRRNHIVFSFIHNTIMNSSEYTHWDCTFSISFNSPIYGAGLDLKNEIVFEEHIMQHFELTILASVEPKKAYSQSNHERLEGDFQKKLMTMDYHGGMNLRDQTKRRHGSKTAVQSI